MSNLTYDTKREAQIPYHPFGSVIPGRTWSEPSLTGAYRFSFTGQEADNEIANDGDYYSFKYRIHDSRLGKFLSMDPLMKKYPYQSPYVFCENRVNDCKELEGAEGLNSTIYVTPAVYGITTVLTITNPAPISWQLSETNITVMGTATTRAQIPVDQFSTTTGGRMYRDGRTAFNSGWNVDRAGLFVWGTSTSSIAPQPILYSNTNDGVTRINTNGVNPVNTVLGTATFGTGALGTVPAFVGAVAPAVNNAMANANAAIGTTTPNAPTNNNIPIATNVPTALGPVNINSSVQTIGQTTVTGINNLTLTITGNPANTAQINTRAVALQTAFPGVTVVSNTTPAAAAGQVSVSFSHTQQTNIQTIATQQTTATTSNGSVIPKTIISR